MGDESQESTLSTFNQIINILLFFLNTLPHTHSCKIDISVENV